MKDYCKCDAQAATKSFTNSLAGEVFPIGESLRFKTHLVILSKPEVNI